MSKWCCIFIIIEMFLSIYLLTWNKNKMKVLHIKESGIALIQVLLITAILTVFAMYLTQTVRTQIKLAMLANDRATAEVESHSIQAEMLFSLLTEDRNPPYGDNEKDFIAKNWNFHSTAFTYRNTRIIMQDQAGLLNLNYLHGERFNRLLIANGIKRDRAVEIAERLLDWMDVDMIPRGSGSEHSNSQGARNGKIADITEIEHILKLSPREKELIYENSTLFYSGDLNPMLTPKALLLSLTSTDVTEQVMGLRQNNLLTISSFQKASGMEYTDDTRYFASNTIAIKYITRVNTVSLEKEIVIALIPYASKGKSPFYTLLERS